MDQIELCLCTVDRKICPIEVLGLSGETIAVATWIPGERIGEIGIPEIGICGIVKEPELKWYPDNFMQNRAFIDAVQSIASTHLDPGLAQYAKNCSEPSVAIIDQRSPDVNAAIPPEDIIGVYSIENGDVVGYSAGPNYRLITESGVFQLTPWLREQLWLSVFENGEADAD